MKKEILTVEENRRLAADIFEMRLSGTSRPEPGTFLEIGVDGFFLKRPFGAAGWSDGIVTIYYRVVGAGTEKMAALPAGTKAEALTGLGHGFDFGGAKKPLIVSGGLGIAPVKYLAEEFYARGIKPVFVAGFRTASEVILRDELEKICDLRITTDDGSAGYNGNAVMYLKDNDISFDRYYACGPEPMLRGMKAYSENGELSLEARMGCGFGACMGCSIKTRSGYKRVCREGPVFEAGEVIIDA